LAGSETREAESVRDRTAKYLSSLHRVLYRSTRGAVGRRLVDNDMCLLTTTGRRSGRQHTVPLLYLQDSRRLVVIASWGGRDRHPEWHLNLLANPAGTVQVLGDRWPVSARTADPNERAVWWPRALAAYDGYAVYESRTDREIPVMFLDPVADPPS
jgi:deazaflavin-dependent oxidoreductase (nitroreductase family)